MGNKKIPKPKQVASSAHISAGAVLVKNINKNPYLRLDFTYMDTGWECFSQWSVKQLERLSKYIKLTREKEIFNIVMKSSGRQCTDSFKEYMEKFTVRFSEDILPAIKAQHLYIGEKERLHGFMHANIFYAVKLDKDHKINDK